MPRRTSLLLLVVAAVAAAPASAAPPPHSARCVQEYGYAGLAGEAAAAGVAARVAALSPPVVRRGHVAAWVGLSGGGTRAISWIQAGVAAFDDGRSAVYYEVKRPGGRPRYAPLPFRLVPGEEHAIAVVEAPGTPGSWRVLVDGHAVTPAIAIAGSHGALRPMVMSESWNAGTRACNVFRFEFENARVLPERGAWHALGRAPRVVDSGYRLVARRGRLLASTRS